VSLGGRTRDGPVHGLAAGRGTRVTNIDVLSGNCWTSVAVWCTSTVVHMPASFVLDPDSAVPIFRQIVNGVRAAIARGAIASGELLPSVRSLAEELGVNPNTVQKAFSELEREGLVAGERGRGMLVLGGTRSTARSGGEDAVLDRLTDAARHARAIGMTDERFDVLLRRARRLVGDGAKETRDK